MSTSPVNSKRIDALTEMLTDLVITYLRLLQSLTHRGLSSYINIIGVLGVLLHFANINFIATYSNLFKLRDSIPSAPPRA